MEIEKLTDTVDYGDDEEESMTTEKCESDDKENVEANISAEEPNRNMK